MRYAVELLEKRRRDHLATANALELKMGEMLEPNTEASVDVIRGHRVRAEELKRAVAVLNASDVVSIEDVKR